MSSVNHFTTFSWLSQPTRVNILSDRKIVIFIICLVSKTDCQSNATSNLDLLWRKYNANSLLTHFDSIYIQFIEYSLKLQENKKICFYIGLRILQHNVHYLVEVSVYFPNVTECFGIKETLRNHFFNLSSGKAILGTNLGFIPTRQTASVPRRCCRRRSPGHHNSYLLQYAIEHCDPIPNCRNRIRICWRTCDRY